ncbi:NAD(+) diphosphatase [Brevundimonas aveniformis]|uniref:NAD(+) diphosphatase n=1 Tax=Brevundimonas aveniformis TaxID=370977 RepID=UPI00249349E3|nr:NAD(+) diphosphatase [Brevundimonas aveniformis]
MPLDPMNVFAGNPLDRAGDRREDDAWLAEQLDRNDGSCLAIWKGSVLVEPGKDGEQIAWLSPNLAREATADDQVFLGLWDQAPVFAAQFGGEADPAVGPLQGLGRFIDLRTAAATLAGSEAAMAGTAQSLFDWHTRHGFCAACGGHTRATNGGWKRQCETCETQHFPRVDPVAIMLPVYSGGSEPVCLLGRQAAWPAKRMSALAGFIEPGESIEEGCAREVLEEAGLVVVSVTYHSSQPWPFPHQLMIGLFCEVDSDQAQPNQTELESVAWLTREEARTVLEGRHPDILAPPPFAIAHQLIRAWVA